MMASAFVVLGTFAAAGFVAHNVGNAGGWRWSYYLNGIIYGLTATLVSVTYFPPRPLLGRKHAVRDLLTGVDYIGILLMSGSITSLIIGVTWGGGVHMHGAQDKLSLHLPWVVLGSSSLGSMKSL